MNDAPMTAAENQTKDMLFEELNDIADRVGGSCDEWTAEERLADARWLRELAWELYSGVSSHLHAASLPALVETVNLIGCVNDLEIFALESVGPNERRRAGIQLMAQALRDALTSSSAGWQPKEEKKHSKACIENRQKDAGTLRPPPCICEGLGPTPSDEQKEGK